MLTAAVLLTNAEATAPALDGFEQLGFSVQVVAPATLVIAGERDLFAERFGVEIQSDGEEGSWVVDQGPETRTLPRAALPPEVAVHVTAVEFEAPLDFGPANP